MLGFITVAIVSRAVKHLISCHEDDSGLASIKPQDWAWFSLIGGGLNLL